MKYIAHSSEYQSQLATLKEVESLVGEDLSHITVVLESNEFDGDETVRADFKFPAFCWRQGDREECVPANIVALMNDPDCQRLIWLSKGLVEGDRIHLAWVFAHEICHVLQFNGVRNVAGFREFLAKHPHLRNFTQLDRADELDSELFAKSLTHQLFGAIKCEAYISRQKLGSRGAAYHAHLELLESSLGGAH